MKKRPVKQRWRFHDSRGILAIVVDVATVAVLVIAAIK